MNGSRAKGRAEVIKVVVVGAAGFGRECLDVLDALVSAGEAIEILGVVDDGPSEANVRRLQARGVPLLGGLPEWIASRDEGTRYVLGIASPDVRKRLVALFDEAGVEPFTAIHPRALVGNSFEAGEGAVICGGVSIGTNVRLGRHVHMSANVTIGHDTELGDFVTVNPAGIVSGEVVVGEGTLVGAGAIVLQMLTVGPGCILGAGTVVTKSTPGGVVVVGVPGRWPDPGQ